MAGHLECLITVGQEYVEDGQPVIAVDEAEVAARRKDGIVSRLIGILDYNRTVLATLLLLLIAGGYAYVTIPKEAEPDVNIPFVYVSLIQRGSHRKTRNAC